MPTSQDLAAFVLSMMTKPIILALAHVHGVINDLVRLKLEEMKLWVTGTNGACRGISACILIHTSKHST